MPLQTQVIPIPLTQGLDAKSDPKAVQMGRFTVLENAVFTAPGRLNKRHGYTALGQAIQGTASNITNGRALLSFNEELLLADGARLYSYSSSSGNWLDRGAAVSVGLGVTSVVRNSHTQSNPDSAVNAGVRVTAWEDGSGGVRCAVQDVESGAFYLEDALISNALDGATNTYAKKPRVVSFGRDLVVFYVVGPNLMYRRIGVSSPTVLGPEVNPISTLVLSAATYDAIAVGSGSGARLFIAFNSTSGSVGHVAYLDATYTINNPPGSVMSNACPNGVGMFSDADQNFYVVGANASTVFAQGFAFTAIPYAAFLVETVANVKAVTGIVTSGSFSSATGGATVYYEVAADGVATHRVVRRNTLNFSTGLAGTASDFRRSVGLAARPFAYGTNHYVAATYQSTLQSTYFVVDATGAVIAKVNPHTGGGLRTNGIVAAAYPVGGSSSGPFEFACCQQSRLAIQSGTLFAFVGAVIASLDFTDVDTFVGAKVQNNFVLGGGILQSYDGVSLTETGFHLFPEGVVADTSTALTVAVTQNGDASHPEITTFTFAGVGRISPAQYFLLNSTTTPIYVWFAVDGIGVDPAVVGRTGVKVSIHSSDSATSVASAVAAAINAAGLAVTASASAAIATTTNSANGGVTHASNPAAPNGVGTGAAAGSVEYFVVYEWTDNYGQIVRSVPSVPIPVTVGATGSVTIAIPTLRITARDGVNRSPVRIAVYRTQDSLPIPYRVTSLTAPLLNDTTIDTLYYFDGAADSTLTGNEILYTYPQNGGPLEHDPPPGGSIVVTYKNRALVAGGQDGNVISYSGDTSPFDAVWFSDDFTISVDQRGGPITALGVLDDKVIVFKRSHIFVFDGEGPNNTGQGSTFSVPALIATDVGCVSQQSVVATNMGLLFQSAKGFYVLDRSLAVQYVGAAVESFNGVTVTGAALVPDTNQVRWTTTGDVCLVYDYLVQQWSTFTNHASAGCTVLDDVFHFVRPTGAVWRENGSSFVDAGNQPIKLRGVTGWISLAGLQGYQRVRKVLVLGDFKGAHKLVLQIATDYSPAFSQYAVIDTAPLVAADVYGSDPVYGASTVYGGEYVPYQFRLHVQRQKSQAIRISFEDAETAPSEGYSINALALEVGLKSGPFKVPATRSV